MDYDLVDLVLRDVHIELSWCKRDSPLTRIVACLVYCSNGSPGAKSDVCHG